MTERVNLMGDSWSIHTVIQVIFDIQYTETGRMRGVVTILSVHIFETWNGSPFPKWLWTRKNGIIIGKGNDCVDQR